MGLKNECVVNLKGGHRVGGYLIHAFVSIFAIMNPLGNVPIFMTLTEGYSLSEKRQTARNASIMAFGILVVFLLLGHVILNLFGITINAFRVTGGILIFGIAYNLLHAKPTHMHSPSDQEVAESTKHDDITVTPLATPLLAGPGTIATVMGLDAGGTGLSTSIVVFIAFTVVLALTFVTFYYSGWISKHLNQTELNVITRMMGLLLAIIAVQMAAAGIRGLFPHLGITA